MDDAKYTALIKAANGILERIDHNGGLGEYKGGPPFAIGELREALAALKPKPEPPRMFVLAEWEQADEIVQRFFIDRWKHMQQMIGLQVDCKNAKYRAKEDYMAIRAVTAVVLKTTP